MARNNALERALHHQGAGRLVEAEAAFRDAVAAAPADAAAHHALALFLLAKGDAVAARPALERAADLAPAPAILSDLALLDAREGRLAQSESGIARALQVDPAHVPSLNMLAFLRLQQGRREEAVTCFARIVELDPAHRPARFNMALALLEVDQVDAAAAAAVVLVQQAPEDQPSLELLAQARSRQNRFADAIALYDRNTALSGADHASVVARNAFALQHACDWSQRERLRARTVARLRSDVPPLLHPFMLLADEAASGQDILAANRAIAAAVPRGAELVSIQSKAWQGGARPRVGYLSADFRTHPLNVLIAELFELHDRDAIEVFGYAYGPPDTLGVRTRLARAIEHFADVTDMSDEAVARRIHDDGIDVLVDLTGYGDDGRSGIAACRPAPIQVNYLGYAATMGAPWIDYVIGDKVVTPAEHQVLYDERLVQLPTCYQPRDRTLFRPTGRPPRAECGLPADGFVFCCFCNSYKITPDVFAVWMRLLLAVPGSVLWLLQTNPLAFANLRASAAAAGVSPDRLIEAEPLPLDRHLARQAAADLFLDTQPYGAHTTASDALWAGVPVVTREGPRFAARVAASVLRHGGFDELVGGSLEDYEAIALRLAREPEYRAGIRDRVAAACASGALFNTTLLARSLEAAYREMARRARDGLAPAGFATSGDAVR